MEKSRLHYDVFMSLKTVFIVEISVDPREMLHCAAFHLGLHCLSKEWSMDIQYKNGEKSFSERSCTNEFLLWSNGQEQDFTDQQTSNCHKNCEAQWLFGRALD